MNPALRRTVLVCFLPINIKVVAGLSTGGFQDVGLWGRGGFRILASLRFLRCFYGERGAFFHCIDSLIVDLRNR